MEGHVCRHMFRSACTPQHTHASAPVQASGPSTHTSEAGTLVHPPQLTCTGTPLLSPSGRWLQQGKLQPAQKPRGAYHSPTPCADNGNLKEQEGPLEGLCAYHPKHFIPGLPCLLVPVPVFRSSGGNMSHRAVLFFKPLGLGSWSWEDRGSETRHMEGCNQNQLNPNFSINLFIYIFVHIL